MNTEEHNPGDPEASEAQISRRRAALGGAALAAGAMAAPSVTSLGLAPAFAQACSPTDLACLGLLVIEGCTENARTNCITVLGTDVVVETDPQQDNTTELSNGCLVDLGTGRNQNAADLTITGSGASGITIQLVDNPNQGQFTCTVTNVEVFAAPGVTVTQPAAPFNGSTFTATGTPTDPSFEFPNGEQGAYQICGTVVCQL